MNSHVHFQNEAFENDLNTYYQHKQQEQTIEALCGRRYIRSSFWSEMVSFYLLYRGSRSLLIISK